MRRSCLLVLFVVAAGGCGVYRVNRAALVPHMTPTLRSGAPLDAQAELSLGASSVAHLGDPEASDQTAGVEIPGTQLEGNARLRLGEHVALGLILAQGLDSTARAAKANQPDVDEGDVRGGGVSLVASVPTSDPRWSVGVELELMTWSVPYVEYGVCVDECEFAADTITNRGRTTVPQVALGVVPTYRAGSTSWFGGVTVRNHPTIEQKGIEHGDDGGDGEVEAGTFNLVLSAGVETELFSGLRGGLVLYTPVNGAPVRYGPSVAAMVTVPLGRDRAR